MPESLPPINAHPFKAPRSLRQAAADGMVVELRCNRCRRRVTYLALDLMRVCSPEHPVHVPPFACGRCRTAEYMSSRCRVPLKEEYGRLTIRRPLWQVWKWGRSYLGD